jgi:hypothetical protein
MGEEFFQPGRIGQILRLGEAAQAHGLAAAQLALHAGELASGAQGAGGGQDGINQAEKKEAQVVGQLEPAPGIAPGGSSRQSRPTAVELCPESVDQPPLAEIALEQWRGSVRHLRSASEKKRSYQ